METVLSTKGQIVVPKAIRDSRGWNAGTKFTVEEIADGFVVRAKPRLRRTTIDDVAGCLRYTGRPKTIAQMDIGIAKAVKQRHDRSRH